MPHLDLAHLSLTSLANRGFLWAWADSDHSWCRGRRTRKWNWELKRKRDALRSWRASLHSPSHLEFGQLLTLSYLELRLTVIALIQFCVENYIRLKIY